MNVRRSLTDSRAINYPFSKSTRRKAGRDSSKPDEEKEILLCQYALLPNALSNGLSKIHRYEDTHRVFQNASGLPAILNLKKSKSIKLKIHSITQCLLSHNLQEPPNLENGLVLREDFIVNIKISFLIIFLMWKRRKKYNKEKRLKTIKSKIKKFTFDNLKFHID